MPGLTPASTDVGEQTVEGTAGAQLSAGRRVLDDAVDAVDSCG
jgi:hypothetical protein